MQRHATAAAALRRRLGGDIYQRSPFHRARLDRMGITRHETRSELVLPRLPPMRLDDVATLSALLLQPVPVAERSSEARRYRPVQWINVAGQLLAYSSDDLNTLASLGCEALEMGGVSSNDVIASFLQPVMGREFWQISLGVQKLGASMVDVRPDHTSGELERFSPSVVVGTSEQIEVALSHNSLGRVHTAIVVGAPASDQLAENCRSRPVEIVQLWAPEGVLALWGQCRGGAGLHIWPQHEVVEVVDMLSGLPIDQGKAGRALWTGIGWYATAIVRLQTDQPLRLVGGRCRACGRTSPRMERLEIASSFAAVLDASESIEAWYAELRRNAGRDFLWIAVAPKPKASSLDVVAMVSREVDDAEVVLTDPKDVEAKRADAYGESFVDRRAMPADEER